jgi:lipopolysaccharide transport system ATP-binding protein
LPTSREQETRVSDIAIKVDQLSKHYRLGAGPQGEGDFRDAVGAAIQRWGRRRSGRQAHGDDDRSGHDLWALRDVSFDVRKGEVVGIIGHNGAGKSTLLKILSRITDPTSGYAWFEGRVGSLLEVGTGFHPELSGRENVFLSGAILGMTRREIAAKFDEIVEFSEIGRFIDTPVKRYSSGMYVRLGFAVAAHLEPEVLIVDEVLAVGDAAFQRKCMAKMQDVSHKGRTILFVSHNMGSIQALCDRAIVLAQGRVVAEGPPAEAAALYLQSTAEQIGVDIQHRTDRRGRGRSRIAGVSVHADGHQSAPGLLLYGQTALLHCDVSDVVPDLSCSFTILDQMTQRVCRFSSRVTLPHDAIVDGRRFTCAIPDLPLVPGTYHVNVSLFSGRELEDSVDSATAFQVEYGSLHGRPLTKEQTGVVFAPRHHWRVPHGRA